MNLILVRHAYLPNVTLGRLHVAGHTYATLEEPWSSNPKGPGGQAREDGKRESCVPDGHYRVVPHSGTKFKNVWALHNPELGVWVGSVPPGLEYGRSAVLLHAGNTVENTEGCILVGRSHGEFNGLPAVLSSRAALDELRAVLGRDAHDLLIRPTNGTVAAAPPQ